ncbi:MAG TPA: septal ring lytic transglycosylase RlpA family protein [Burkholderiaceae bacterium]|nr:septal ring lytic transglycosylase RlpA family protein [Burkholderiaceae bacterium]
MSGRRKPIRNAGRAIAIALAALLLVSCGSAPRAPAQRTDAAGLPAPDTGRSRGGYYLDDGPDPNPPPNLHEVPDAVPRDEPVLVRTTRPYEIFGRRYVPMARREPFRERGVASWYGRRFHGQPTATGEPYDMYAMTAAHPTLPLPSYVRVTHLRNGRSVVVRVNDRGPFLGNRVIDLSYTAALRLGFIEAGSAEVDVELILPGDAPVLTAAATPPAPADDPLLRIIEAAGAEDVAAFEADAPVAQAAGAKTAAPAAYAAQPVAANRRVALQVEPSGGGSVWLQLGSFSSRDNAESARAKLARQLDWLGVPLQVLRHAGAWKVHAGPFAGTAPARAAADRVQQAIDLRPMTVLR